jgi:hypothetical protein
MSLAVIKPAFKNYHIICPWVYLRFAHAVRHLALSQYANITFHKIVWFWAISSRQFYEAPKK